MDETDLCCCCMIECVASHRIKLNTTNVLNVIYLLLIHICHRHDEKVGIIQQKYCNVADYCEFWLEKMKAFCYTSVECFLFVGHFNNMEVFFFGTELTLYMHLVEKCTCIAHVQRCLQICCATSSGRRKMSNRKLKS